MQLGLVSRLPQAPIGKQTIGVSATKLYNGNRRSELCPWIDDYLAEDNPVRAIDVFVDELNLGGLGFYGVVPEATGRPAYHPATLLKIYVYGYLNRVQSSRRLERECQRNIELVWLTGRLMPDFKTIADFRKDNGEAIRKVGREFVVLCRRLELFSEASVAIDGSKFKAVKPSSDGRRAWRRCQRDMTVEGLDKVCPQWRCFHRLPCFWRWSPRHRAGPRYHLARRTAVGDAEL